MFKNKKRAGNIIELSGKIDIPNNLIRVDPSSGDQWTDFGYWLEATSFMAKQAMLNKGWSEVQMKKYIRDYLEKAFVTYSIVDNKDNLYKPE